MNRIRLLILTAALAIWGDQRGGRSVYAAPAQPLHRHRATTCRGGHFCLLERRRVRLDEEKYAGTSGTRGG